MLIILFSCATAIFVFFRAYIKKEIWVKGLVLGINELFDRVLMKNFNFLEIVKNELFG